MGRLLQDTSRSYGSQVRGVDKSFLGANSCHSSTWCWHVGRKGPAAWPVERNEGKNQEDRGTLRDHWHVRRSSGRMGNGACRIGADCPPAERGRTEAGIALNPHAHESHAECI